MAAIKNLILAAVLPTVWSAGAQTVEYNSIKYDLDPSTHTATAIEADTAIEEAVVVSTISHDDEDYSVTALGDMTFFKCEALKSVSLPATLTSVGSFTFYGCTVLERVDIPSLKDWLEISFNGIGNPLLYAHNLYIDGTLLENLDLPEGLEKVPDFSFSGASITSLTIPSTVTEIGRNAFYECTSLTTFEGGSSLTTIGSQAFDSCSSLYKVSLSPLVSTVGSYAFEDCSALEEIVFGSAVTSVGTDAFAGCTALKGVDAADVASWCRIDFASSAANPLGQAHVLRIDGEVVKAIEIPAGISEVKSTTFAGCTEIESVVLGADVVNIGESAFAACTALKRVHFDGPVDSIGESAFRECTMLQECALPESLTSIGSYAFDATALTEVLIPEGVTTLGSAVFSECTALKTVSIPSGLTSLGFGCFYGCTALEEIDMSGIEKIGKSAFYGCTSLSKVSLGTKTESISGTAFGQCTSLKEICVLSEEPPVAPESAFSDYSAALYVMAGSMEAYAADSTWGLFKNIRPYTTGGVSDISAGGDIVITGSAVTFGTLPADAVVEVVRLDGRTVYHGAPVELTLPSGFYIIRTPATTVKVSI